MQDTNTSTTSDDVSPAERMPYAKWYARDWIGDAQLRVVSLQARGAWIDLLCVMMMSDPYGHLAMNGDNLTDEQVARLIGTDIGTYKGCLAELVSAGIPSFTDTGIMYSRRLVRDYERFAAASQAGHKGGGNPRLRRNSKKNPKSIIQKPEARQPIKVPFIGTYKGVTLPGWLVGLPGWSEELWQAWMATRKGKQASNAPYAIGLLVKKLAKRPEQAVEAIQTAIEAGWTGFEWEWFDSRREGGFANKSNQRDENGFTEADYLAAARENDRQTAEWVARQAKLEADR